MKSNNSFNEYTSRNTGASSLDLAINRHMSEIGYDALVQVEGVNNPNGLQGSVNVKILVHQQDSSGDTVPHGIIYNVPYMRVQGGKNAFIVDPEIGDIGFIIISGRDHSNVIKTRKPSNPASFRKFSFSDCVYVPGFLNEIPENYIYITKDGVRVNSQKTIITGDLTVEGTITSKNDVIADGVSLKNHTHGGVMGGSSITMPPNK